MSEGTGQQSANTKKQSAYAKFDHLAMVYILRGITSEEKALSAEKLANMLKVYLGEEYSSKTAGRKLKEILDIQDWRSETDPAAKEEKRRLAKVLFSLYGGKIRAAGGEHKRFYFEPCLDDASMKMLNGTVVTNSFLSQEEKRYLLSKMRYLNMLGEYGERAADKGNPDEDKPDPYDEEVLAFPGEENLFLHNTVLLEQCITAGWQVEMTYGIYDYDIDGGVIDYHERCEEAGIKKYRINPYAMFWNEGHYYLLATYDINHQPAYMKEIGTPVNFRVDRIVKISVVMQEEARGRKKVKLPVSREPIPSRLKEFFKEEDIGYDTYPADAAAFDSDMDEDEFIWVNGYRDQKQCRFDAKAYCARFPRMRISEHSNPITCRLECTPWSLQILIDTFGSVLKISESSKIHDKNELDYNGRPQTFIEVQIEQVEFENIRDFCLANPEYITPVSPRPLVNAVKEKLEKILKRYS